ncbi:MAG: sugar phosphate isomerase/epimerase [Clostridia bacterium]|nr:sugar phosphate isomerase/epimerase [Clostridia bacterium]
MAYHKISGFSDEIAPEINAQFEGLNRLGIKYFEPRFIDGKNISKFSEEELKALKAKMDSYGIKASSIGSPIGKINLTDDFDEHFEVFKNVVRAAEILESKYIRIFSFYNEGGVWDDSSRAIVLAELRKYIAYAKEHNVVLLHENERDIYGDNAERCLDLMKELYCDNFKGVFDPANFVLSGVDTKAAFDMLQPYIEYMHIKDASSDGKVLPSGMGEGNLEYILKNLFDGGFDGYLSLEPHLGNFVGLANLETGDIMKGLPEGGEGTFTLAYNSLNNILGGIINE